MVRWLSILMVLAVGMFYVAPASARADEKKKSKPAEEKKDSDEKTKKDDKEKAEEEHGFMGVQLGGEEEGPVTIAGVTDDSPAAKAGIKEGDQIVKVGDKDVKSVQDVMTRMQTTKPGDKLTITVKRDGKEHKYTLTLAKRPAENP